MPTQSFLVTAEQAGQNLDKVLAHTAQVSRRVARTWIAAGRVTVNDKPMRILTKPLRAGVKVTYEPGDVVESPREQVPHVAPEVLFLDKDIIVVDKPAQLLSEHDRFGSPSLESVIPRYLQSQGERNHEVWLVHRLDAGTSGVIVLARSRRATAALSDAFRETRVQKQYWALVHGRVTGERFIDAPIGKAERTRHKVTPEGKPAQTRVTVLSSNTAGSLVLAEPKTGRTHQIRVHLASVGHPLMGDRLYGGPGYTLDAAAEPIARPMLHARRLSFTHPTQDKPLTFEAPPPKDFRALAERLGLTLETPEQSERP